MKDITPIVLHLPMKNYPADAKSRNVKMPPSGSRALDTINRACGIRFCVDLSATPFYIQGSGHPEGSPFPWLVSDFGLVDAIEERHHEDSSTAGERYDGQT